MDSRGRSGPVKRASPTIGGLRLCRANKPNFERRPAARDDRMMRMPKQTQSAGRAGGITGSATRNKANRHNRPGASIGARMQNKANMRGQTRGSDEPILRNKANRDGGRQELTVAGKGSYETRCGRRACEKQSQFALPDRRWASPTLRMRNKANSLGPGPSAQVTGRVAPLPLTVVHGTKPISRLHPQSRRVY
jgi:hypothetical protein